MDDVTWRSYFTSVIEPNTNIAAVNDNDRTDPNTQNTDGQSQQQQQQQNQQNQQQQKPPKARAVGVERPCSLILAEEFMVIPQELGYDTSSSMSNQQQQQPPRQNQQRRRRGNYYQSWHTSFSNIFPQQYGIPYTKWSITDPEEHNFDDDNEYDDNEYEEGEEDVLGNKMTFDVAISKMKDDFRSMTQSSSVSPSSSSVSSSLALLQQPILIARGPVLSWMAQFYLESLPLSGLIMIDPIPFTTPQAYDLYRKHYQQYRAVRRNNNSSTGSNGSGSRPGDMILPRQYYNIIQDYDNHWDHWTLKIEAGSIPMLVLSTKISDSMSNDDRDNEGTNDDNDNDEMNILQMDQMDDVYSDNSGDGVDVEDVHLWREYAEQTAQRHSTTSTMSKQQPHQLPEVIDIDPSDAVQCSTIIHDWINDRVL